MKILFIDSYTNAYDTRTHLTRPLGGTQATVSSLSKALAQAGHSITVINGVTAPHETDGVHFMTLPCPTPVLNDFDVVVLVSAALAQTLREIGCTRPLVMWAHHAADQPAVQPLLNPAERSLYAGFAQVSQWQADSYSATFGVDPAKVKILRNIVSPAFFERPPASRWLKTGAPPVLAYSSTPYRGLDILLLSFASIRKKLEGATLRVFSSMGIYGADVPDEYESLYDLAHNLPGVSYVGPLSQPRLAEAMAEVDLWTYPCTFAETSCISALEAMAAGTTLVSTTLGSLPETTAGYAHLMDLRDAPIPGMAATRFARHVIDVAEKAQTDPAAVEGTLAAQTAFVRTNYNANTRAAEWIEWLEQIL